MLFFGRRLNIAFFVPVFLHQGKDVLASFILSVEGFIERGALHPAGEHGICTGLEEHFDDFDVAFFNSSLDCGIADAVFVIGVYVAALFDEEARAFVVTTVYGAHEGCAGDVVEAVQGALAAGLHEELEDFEIALLGGIVDDAIVAFGEGWFYYRAMFG